MTNSYDTRSRLDRWAPNRARKGTELWYFAMAMIAAGVIQVGTGLAVILTH